MELKKAKRSAAKLRLGVAGPSGSGKTYSALRLANGLVSWDKIAVIDTEKGSADLYADLGEYSTIKLTPPYSPKRYIEALKTCEEAGMEFVIIDSISHLWEDEGGFLEINQKFGGKFQDWMKTNPIIRKWWGRLLDSPCHIIVTSRKKQDYSMDQVNGKTKIQKVGLKNVQRDGYEYDLTASFDIDIEHMSVASKDRTGLFMSENEQIPFLITQQTGKDLKSWLEGSK